MADQGAEDLLSSFTEKFDSSVLQAAIEHISDPSQFLAALTAHIVQSPAAWLAVTTPPCSGWVHDTGDAFGLVSKHANKEHEILLDLTLLEMDGAQAGLNLVLYRRFLFGANHIAVLKEDCG